MKVLLAPGMAIMNRFTTAQRMLLVAVIFNLLFTGLLYSLSRRSAVDWLGPVALAALAFWLLGNYLVLAQHLQVGAAFGKLREAVQRFSAGDLTTAGKGARGSRLLPDRIAEMGGSLASIFAQVRTSAETIGEAAKEMASGHVNLSTRTEEQASTLEEMASGMEELSGTVKQNADSCQAASGLRSERRRVGET